MACERLSCGALDLEQVCRRQCGASRAPSGHGESRAPRGPVRALPGATPPAPHSDAGDSESRPRLRDSIQPVSPGQHLLQQFYRTALAKGDADCGVMTPRDGGHPLECRGTSRPRLRLQTGPQGAACPHLQPSCSSRAASPFGSGPMFTWGWSPRTSAHRALTTGADVLKLKQGRAPCAPAPESSCGTAGRRRPSVWSCRQRLWCQQLPDLQDKPGHPLFVPPQCRPAPVVIGNPPTRVPTILTHEPWPANHPESSHASRGKPLAHSHRTSTSPTTGDLTIPSRALDRQGIRLRVSPANSLNGYRELLSIRGCATVSGASWFPRRLAAPTLHLPTDHYKSLASPARVS